MITALAQAGSALPVSTYLNDPAAGESDIRQRKRLADKFGRAKGVLGAHANAVHGRGVIVRRRNLREDRLRGNTIEAVVDGNFLDR